MCTTHARKLFLALLLLGGVTLVGLAIAYSPAAAVPGNLAPTSQAAAYSISAQAVLTPTHPYTPTLQFITAAGGAGGDIVAGNGYAYVGDGVQLSVYDVSNKNAPLRVARLGLRGAICQMELVDNLLYVAARFGGLRIYEVSDPAQPRLLGVYADEQITCPFYVAGDLVYAINDFRLQAIDVSNPAAPFLRDAVDIYYRYGPILPVGDQVYVDANVVDASHPDQLEIAATITGTWVAVEDELAVANGVECFKGSCWGGLIFYDISDPKNPQPQGSYSLGYYTSVLVDGDVLYIDSKGGTDILDISQPQAPVLLSFYPGTIFEKNGDWLYVRSWQGGLEVVDVGKPAKPELVGSYITPNYIYDYARSGNSIFLRTVVPFGNYHELQVVDITYPANPYMAGNSYELYISAVSEAQVEGERAYALANGFSILDYRNAADPVILGSHRVSDLVLYDLNIVGDFAYIIGGDQLKVLDILDPSQPAVIQTYGGDGDAYPWITHIKMLDNHLGYVVAADADWLNYRTNLQIMQFAPPAPPVIYSVHTSPPNEYITALDGDENHVFIARTSGAVELLDTSNPYSPTVTGFYSSTQRVSVLRQAGDLLLVGGEYYDVQIVDFSNPLSPSLVSEIAIPMQINDIQVDGGWAYVAADDNGTGYWQGFAGGPGVWVYNIHDPYNPTLLGIYPSKVRHIQIADGLMYLSADKDGLQVVGLLQPSMYLPQVLRENP
jgi:hypothetical protein